MPSKFTATLDTNVLLRLITQDDSNQTAKIHAILEKHADTEKPFLITLVNICEVVWVLRSFYKFSKSEII